MSDSTGVTRVAQLRAPVPRALSTTSSSWDDLYAKLPSPSDSGAGRRACFVRDARVMDILVLYSLGEDTALPSPLAQLGLHLSSGITCLGNKLRGSGV
ncbi:unnamed protein product [Lampetra fluviatilis]